MSVAHAEMFADPEVVLRRALIDTQLRPNSVTEPRVLEAVAELDRKAFVPEQYRAMAYIDRSVPLDGGRALNPVLTTTRLIVDAEIRPGEKVLLIGAASGYAAALLAKIGATVTAVESDAALAEQARTNLAEYVHASVVEGPLDQGAAAAGPFDVLFIDGAVESIPESLAAQLVEGGRIVSGLYDNGVTKLVRDVHIGDVAVSPFPFADLECVRLPGFAKPSGFTF